MRKNIFELMKGNEIDLYSEYYRLYKLFQRTDFEDEGSVMKFIEWNYFSQWKHRKRYISINDLLNSLEISREYVTSDNITMEKLLLYCETIYNLINLIDCSILYSDNVIDVLRNNILDLLEDLNYEIKINNKEQFVIIEKDKMTTAVAEKFSDITDTVIEYRRFSLKGNIEGKKAILSRLSEKIEPLRQKFNSTEYKSIIDDINMLLNNLNIRHNNLEGKYKKEYTINMAKEDLENWYNTTYDLILNALMLEDYIDNKKNIDELKSHY